MLVARFHAPRIVPQHSDRRLLIRFELLNPFRLIEQDDESFLAWARESWACVIFNLHVTHSPQGIEQAADSFRGLIDLGIKHGGSYYLTYHKFARREQVVACYPQFQQFLALKKKYDPDEHFQSDWYRHYRKMFG